MSSSIPDTDRNIPAHIAIIMDGNGRWAMRRGLPRSMGHRQGAKALKRTVRAAGEMGVKYLTLFGFSSENWSRPEQEVSELMRLLRYYLRSETAELMKNNIRLRIIGDISAFDPDIRELMAHAEDLSKNNEGLYLSIALNYGGRNEIVNAVQSLLIESRESDLSGLSVEALQQRFESRLLTAGIPDPDLLIRTSGELRVSNFLLWQCAYSEFYFTDTLWPDFGKASLEEAIDAYTDRDRRFGGLTSAKEGQ